MGSSLAKELLSIAGARLVKEKKTTGDSETKLVVEAGASKGLPRLQGLRRREQVKNKWRNRLPKKMASACMYEEQRLLVILYQTL